LKAGNHLRDLFSINQTNIGGDQFKKLKQNKDERYHFLSPCDEYQIPELIIDFKIYYTLQVDYIENRYHDCYLATINELFRELLSQRFTNYISRIGLPKIIGESGK